MNAPFPHNISRRRFLKQSAGLTIGFTLAASPLSFAQQAPGKPAPLPGSLQTNRMLDGWLRINPNGTVTMMTGKIELGQGITTALSQIVCDELDVALGRLEIISGDTARTPNEGVTSGSLSIQDSGTALAGNLCRCGTHSRIIRAVQRAAQTMAAGVDAQQEVAA